METLMQQIEESFDESKKGSKKSGKSSIAKKKVDIKGPIKS